MGQGTEDRDCCITLCRRSIHPSRDFWTPTCGWGCRLCWAILTPEVVNVLSSSSLLPRNTKQNQKVEKKLECFLVECLSRFVCLRCDLHEASGTYVSICGLVSIRERCICICNAIMMRRRSDPSKYEDVQHREFVHLRCMLAVLAHIPSHPILCTEPEMLYHVIQV
jgi:hypothetical protein